MEDKIDKELLKINFMKLFKDRYFKTDKIIFGDNDIGICHRDDTKKNNELTKHFIENGAKPQYFIKTTNIYKNELRGRKIENETITDNNEMKLFKTVHSFQGRELNDEQKIFLAGVNSDLYKLRNRNQLCMFRLACRLGLRHPREDLDSPQSPIFVCPVLLSLGFSQI
jgi:hypothetical protein